MLTKRIIPCLDIKDGRTVKGVNFVGLIDAGNPVELAKIYSDNGADELVFLDITATHEKRKTLLHLVEEVAKVVKIPFTVGGGISEKEDVDALLPPLTKPLPNIISIFVEPIGLPEIVAA